MDGDNVKRCHRQTTTQARRRVASLGARVRHWWGMVVGARPPFAPLVVLTPVSVAGCVSPLLRVVVVGSVGGVLLDVYGTRGLTIG